MIHAHQTRGPTVVADVGASYFRAGAVGTEEPAICLRTHEITGDPTVALAKLMSSLIDKFHPTALVVGTPGLVDRDGSVGPALYSLLTNVDLRRRLVDLLPRAESIAVINDAALLAVGVAELERASISSSHLHIVTGTAVGGALLIDGTIFPGVHGFAGEVGHVRAGLTDKECACGQTDCVDLVASGWSLAADLGVGWWNRPNSHDVRARLGLAATALARGISTCHQVADLASFSISGPLMSTAPWLGEATASALSTYPRLEYVDTSQRDHWELATAGADRVLELDRAAHGRRLHAKLEQS